jgi:hypothetical protein
MVERDPSMRATVFHGVVAAFHVEQDDLAIPDPEQPRLPGAEVRGARDLDMTWHGLDFSSRTADVLGAWAI